MYNKIPETTGRSKTTGIAARRQLVLDQLRRPRTQTELQEQLGMSRSGTRHLLRRMAREGLIRPAERIGVTQIWEREEP
mgnify:CR=1 FL=1